MKTKYGYMKCPDCDTRVVVKKNENETLGYRCDECDGNGYVRKGEGRYELWVKRIEVTAAPAAKPKAAPAAPGDEKPRAPAPAARKTLAQEFNS